MSGTVRVRRPDGLGMKGRARPGTISLTETVTIRFSAEDVELLNAVAAHDRVPVTVIVRRVVREWLELRRLP